MTTRKNVRGVCPVFLAAAMIVTALVMTTAHATVAHAETISLSAEEETCPAGDINGDGAVNNKDLTRLFQYLSDWDVELHGESAEGDPDTDEDGIEVTSFVYGKSESGRDLVCHSIDPASYAKTVLLEFEIHGFEDEYAHEQGYFSN